MAVSESAAELGPDVHTPVPGARSQALVEQLAATECPAMTARRARRSELSGAPHDPIVWARASGANVWDVDGNRYVDLSAGFGAAAVGHGHPRVVAAVQAQAGQLLHALGDVQPSDVKVALLSRLAALAPFPEARVLLGLNGGDAVTAALKTAALFTKRPGVLAFVGGYHGLEHGPLAACGYSERFRAPFAEQLNPHVVFAPYPSADRAREPALRAVAEAWGSRADIGAVLVEPVLGRGGVIVPPMKWLAGLAKLCKERGALLIADEVLTGLGRTGALFRCATERVTPDLLCLGKALGGGLPVSACLGRPEVMAAWGDPGSEALHTATFFGNPLGCAAALAALDVIEQEGLGLRALQLGEWLRRALEERVGKRVVEVRGAGLLVGLELASGAQGLAAVHKLLQRGYITVPAGEDARVISLSPPLAISELVLQGFLSCLPAVLDEVGA